MKTANIIPINFWDDFEEGKNTYAYIEDGDIEEGLHEAMLIPVCEYIRQNLYPDVRVILHDSKINFTEEQVDRLTSAYGEKFFWKRWQIVIEKCSYVQLDAIVEGLQKADLLHNGCKYKFYSES